MAVEKQQFQLPLTATTRPLPRLPARQQRQERTLPERVIGIDQVLSTHDVERITGRHRCTIYRWVRAGTFPAKRVGPLIRRAELLQDQSRMRRAAVRHSSQPSLATGGFGVQ